MERVRPQLRGLSPLQRTQIKTSSLIERSGAVKEGITVAR